MTSNKVVVEFEIDELKHMMVTILADRVVRQVSMDFKKSVTVEAKRIAVERLLETMTEDTVEV